MKATVRHEMHEAVVSYEEKPRETWVFEPPAQVALCAVQIWWTVETNVAFLRLEEGFENSLKDFNKKQVRTSYRYCDLPFWSTHTHTHTHTHTRSHSVLTAIFPGEPGFAGCPLNSPSPFIPGLRILLVDKIRGV